MKAEKEVNDKRAADAAAAALPEVAEGENAEAEVEAVEAAGEPEQAVETPEAPAAEEDKA